jgi:hypothetical protein
MSTSATKLRFVAGRQNHSHAFRQARKWFLMFYFLPPMTRRGEFLTSSRRNVATEAAIPYKRHWDLPFPINLVIKGLKVNTRILSDTIQDTISTHTYKKICYNIIHVFYKNYSQLVWPFRASNFILVPRRWIRF